MKFILLFIGFIIFSPTLLAAQFSNTPYQLCFTPGGKCTSVIVDKIDSAKKSIYVQAYSFTSKYIAKALIDAERRGVSVNIILDKSQIKHGQYSSAKFFINQKIPVWIDYKPAIAHNKVIIIDDKIVITGSFNFTKAAEERNAENVLIIENTELANAYLTNWHKRQEQSFKRT